MTTTFVRPPRRARAGRPVLAHGRRAERHRARVRLGPGRHARRRVGSARASPSRPRSRSRTCAPAWRRTASGSTPSSSSACSSCRARTFRSLRAARERHFGAHRPTSTSVYVPQLASPKFLLEIEAIAAKRVERLRAADQRLLTRLAPWPRITSVATERRKDCHGPPTVRPTSNPRRRIAVRGARGLRTAHSPRRQHASRKPRRRRRTRSRFSTKSSASTTRSARKPRASAGSTRRTSTSTRTGSSRISAHALTELGVQVRETGGDLQRSRRADRRAAQARAPEARPHAAGARQTRRRTRARRHHDAPRTAPTASARSSSKAARCRNPRPRC